MSSGTVASLRLLALRCRSGLSGGLSRLPVISRLLSVILGPRGAVVRLSRRCGSCGLSCSSSCRRGGSASSCRGHLFVVLLPGLGVVWLGSAWGRLAWVSGSSGLGRGSLSWHSAASRLLVVLCVISRPRCVRICCCFTGILWLPLLVRVSPTLRILASRRTPVLRSTRGSGLVRVWVVGAHGSSGAWPTRSGTNRAEGTLDLVLDQLFGVVDLLRRAADGEQFKVWVSVGRRLA